MTSHRVTKGVIAVTEWSYHGHVTIKVTVTGCDKGIT